MKKAIVFGANGYLGRHLVKSLEDNNIDVLPCGRKPNSIDNKKNYRPIDITKLEDIQTLNFEVDYIFVFAGLTGTYNGFEKYKDFINVNENGLLNILEHRRWSQGNAKIIFPSTRLVYKGIKNTALKEEAEKEAKTIYAQNKLACESYLKMYSNSFDIDYTIYRICVPYGNLFDEQYSYGTIGFFLNKAMKGEDITLYGDGQLFRTFSHVQDIFNLLIASLPLSASNNTTFNIGSRDNLSLLEVATMIAHKYKVGIQYVDWPMNALKIESGDTIFDGGKLELLTNYSYRHSLEQWINTFS